MQSNIVLLSLSRSELTDMITHAVSEVISKTKEKSKTLLTFNETCELLSIHPSTLNKWKRENLIPSKKLGNRIYFDRNEITASLKDSGYKKLKRLEAFID